MRQRLFILKENFDFQPGLQLESHDLLIDSSIHCTDLPLHDSDSCSELKCRSALTYVRGHEIVHRVILA